MPPISSEAITTLSPTVSTIIENRGHKNRHLTSYGAVEVLSKWVTTIGDFFTKKTFLHTGLTNKSTDMSHLPICQTQSLEPMPVLHVAPLHVEPIR